MNIMIIGCGGREYAIAWKISQSPLINTIYNTPISDAMQSMCVECNVIPERKEEFVRFCIDKKIDLVIIGPENFLEIGVADALEKESISVFGPCVNAARIETSKVFMKNIAEQKNIKTAKYKICNSLQDILAIEGKCVIKQDSLASGKGVFIAEKYIEKKQAFDQIKKNDANSKIFAEEFLTGKEFSAFALVHKKNICFLGTACDYKKLIDNDLGPNTGGMGSYNPYEKENDKLAEELKRDIFGPVMEYFNENNIEYTGVIFAGLISTSDGIYLLEFNARFGDPETQSMLFNMKSDFLEIIIKVMNNQTPEIVYHESKSVCVSITHRDYPYSYQESGPISIKDCNEKDVEIFHAGTFKKDGKWYTNKGRVLSVVARGSTYKIAREKAYRVIKNCIDWDDCYYRKDICLDIK